MMISMGRPSISPAPCPNRISAAGLQKAIVPAPSTTNRAYSAALANPNTAALADCVRMVFQSVHHEAGEVREPVPVCFVEICMRLGIEHAE